LNCNRDYFSKFNEYLSSLKKNFYAEENHYTDVNRDVDKIDNLREIPNNEINT